MTHLSPARAAVPDTAPRLYGLAMTCRQILVNLPSDMDDRDHAELANAIWAVAFGASSIEVVAPNPDAVNAEMDRLWKIAPEWTGTEWRRPPMS